MAQLVSVQADIQRIAADIAYVPKSEKEKALLLSKSNGDVAISDRQISQESDFNVDEEIQKSAARLKGVQPNETDLEVRNVISNSYFINIVI